MLSTHLRDAFRSIHSVKGKALNTWKSHDCELYAKQLWYY